MERNVDSILANPPYDVRTERSMNNSLHGIFKLECMRNLVDFSHPVMATRERWHVFCSCTQILEQYMKLESKHDRAPNFEANSETEVSMRRVIFEVDSVPPYYTPALSSYQYDQTVKKHISHITDWDCLSVLECQFGMGWRNIKVWLWCHEYDSLQPSWLDKRNEQRSLSPSRRGNL